MPGFKFEFPLKAARPMAESMGTPKCPVLNPRVPISLVQTAFLAGPSKPSFFCASCLGLGHQRKVCTQMVRCKICYNYGHISSDCLPETAKNSVTGWFPVRNAKSRDLCLFALMLPPFSPPPPTLPTTVSEASLLFSNGELGGRPLSPCLRRLHDRGITRYLLSIMMNLIMHARLILIVRLGSY